MDRKDEIIQLQNEIMQGLLRQRMQSLTEDLWGIKPTSLQKPVTQPEKSPAAPSDGSPASPPPAPSAAQAAQPEQKEAREQDTPPEKIEDLKAEDRKSVV